MPSSAARHTRAYMRSAAQRFSGSILRRQAQERGWEAVQDEADREVSTDPVRDCLQLDATLAKSLLAAVLLGGLTSVTGVYIAINCDYLSDLRFGYCRGLPLSDRSHCCGGTDNVDATSGRCVFPMVVNVSYSEEELVDWLPWDEVLHFPFLVYLAVSVTLAVLAAVIVYSFAPAAKGSGIPDVKAAVSGFAINHCFSPMCLLLKALGLAMGVGAGLSLGKEGPLIHIGTCWGYVLRHSRLGLLGSLARTVPIHEVICVGAAAGVATAFGAPVGGVLFAVEELGSVRALSQRALMLAFAGSFSASFILKSWNLYGSNQLTFFKLATPTNSPSKEWRSWEMPFFVVLGISGGLIGALFVKLNISISRHRRKQLQMGRLWLLPPAAQAWVVNTLPSSWLRAYSHNPEEEKVLGLLPHTIHVLEAAILATGTATINYILSPLLRQPMTEVIHATFESCPNALGMSLGLCDPNTKHGFTHRSKLQVELLLAAMVRFLETAVTFGAMLPAGLFIPSMYIGAVVGRFTGNWLMEVNAHFALTTPVNPSVFAMVGAVAGLSGFARMTVSLVVIMLELTGEINYAVPFMSAVLASKLTGDSFTPSIYEGVSTLLGYASFEETPSGMRLSACIGDVAVVLPNEDVLDVSRPIKAEVLHAAVARELEGLAEEGASELSLATFELEDSNAAPSMQGLRQEEAGGAVSSSSPPQRSPRSSGLRSPSPTPANLWALDVLLLVGGSPRQVCGAIRKEVLYKWLQTGKAPTGSLCRFSHATNKTAPDSLSERPEIVTADELLTAPGTLRRLLPAAPLLTAVCAFREFPELEYCVCQIEDGALAVLSRTRLEWALRDGKFAASFKDETLLGRSPQSRTTRSPHPWSCGGLFQRADRRTVGGVASTASPPELAAASSTVGRPMRDAAL